MNIYAEILKAEKQKKDFALLTVVRTDGSVPRHESSKMMVFSDGSIIGTIGGGTLEKKSIEEAVKQIGIGQSKLLEYRLNIETGNDLNMVCGGNADVFIEVHKTRPKLVICGAGHVGKALSTIAGTVDFDITIIDNRPEWANDERFPEAGSIIVREDITKAIDELYTDSNTYFVVATWGHKYDKVALKSTLYKESCYVGMMGSPTKAKELFSQLLEEGVSKELLDKVHTPIGLDIKAETPEEIAISIMAEVIMVKNSATGRPMSEGREN